MSSEYIDTLKKLFEAGSCDVITRRPRDDYSQSNFKCSGFFDGDCNYFRAQMEGREYKIKCENFVLIFLRDKSYDVPKNLTGMKIYRSFDAGVKEESIRFMNRVGKFVAGRVFICGESQNGTIYPFFEKRGDAVLCENLLKEDETYSDSTIETFRQA